MKVFITNDDGFFAEGLQALYRVFGLHHDVTVVAPDRERSAAGHGITLQSPLRCRRVALGDGLKGYAVNGLPADCIKLGLNELLNRKPDVVISGINPGANVSVNINYSGTVAAAKEAALYGIPAISVSIVRGDDPPFAEVAHFIKKLAVKVATEGLEPGTFLNVNFPNLPFDHILGVKLSRQGIRLHPEHFEKHLDPRKQVYYWQGCDELPTNQDPDIDSTIVHQGFISITPIKCDMTDYKVLKYMKKLGFESGFKHLVYKSD
jgi:5'-nucleotidase